MRLNLRTKFIVYILLATIVIYTPSIAYLGLKNHDNYYKVSIENFRKDIEEIGIDVSNKIDEYFVLLNTLSQVNTGLFKLSYAERQQIILDNYKNVLKNNNHIDGIWDSWEITKTDSSEQKRVVYSAERVANTIRTDTEIKALTPLYLEIKNAGEETVVEPYLYSFTRKKEDLTFVTSLAVHLKTPDKKTAGLVGMDLKLNNINKLIRNKYSGGRLELISAKGVYLLTGDSNMLAKKTKLADTLFTQLKSEPYVNFDTYENGEDYYNILERVKLGKSKNYWYLHFSIPKYEVTKDADAILNYTFLIGIIGLGLLALFIYLVVAPFLNPLVNITKQLDIISEGRLNSVVNLNFKRKDELGAMAQALSKMIKSLKEKAGFAEQIGKGNLDTSLDLQSEQDTLGIALLQMKDNLAESKKVQEEYRKEEEKRKWANKGFAFFAELLRKNNSSLDLLLHTLTKNISKYLDANQCAIFLKKEDEDVLEMMSAYAYSRKKSIKKEVLVGEGLVGACFIERESIYMTEIPDNYINITSGLGKANPKALILVPIKTDEEIIGVIEIASFNEIEKYQREFLEKLSETIAGTIINVRNNIKMKELFEQTSQQAEEMRAQEEEMRQNMEELLATQEENDRKTEEIENFMQALHSSNLIIEINEQGAITFVSEALAKYFGVKPNALTGKDFKDIFYPENYDEMSILWQEIITGKSKKTVSEFIFNGEKYKFYDTFVPILDSEGELKKVIRISFDTETFNK